jgi:ubiquinone/menaquinone biosynthesis C-methylase UbiE
MIERSRADGVFKVSLPEQGMEFAGERMTTAVEGEIEFEHFHRYCLARDLCSSLDVLDVASGEGYGSSILADVARSVTGVDVDPEAVAHARTTYGKENLRFIHGSVLDLPLDDASVDAVVSFETLEHVREHVRFMAEVKRVLRAGGHLIVSTPARAIYSARGEPVNKFHLLELSEAEFNSFLRANFKYVLMLNQRAILGSVIVKPQGGGAWRSYERRSLEYIEASSGLARAPFLIGIASDEELGEVPSSIYLDRRRPGELVGACLQLPAYQSQVAALGAEIGRLNEAASRREAEMTVLESRLNEAASRREAEITELEVEARRLAAALSARDAELSSVRAQHDAKIAWLNHERNADAARLVSLQDRYDKLTRSFRWRFVDGVVHFPRTTSRSLRRPFMRVAFHKNGRPRGWIRGLGFKPKATRAIQEIVSPIADNRADRVRQAADPASSERRSVQTAGGPSSAFDDRKATILVVSHEASRSGAPILALNLVQKLPPISKTAHKFLRTSLIPRTGARVHGLYRQSERSSPARFALELCPCVRQGGSRRAYFGPSALGTKTPRAVSG